MNVAIDLDGVIAMTPDIISRELDNLGFKDRDNSQYEPKIKGVEDISSLMNNVVDDIFINKMDDIKPYEGVNDNLFKEISMIAGITILTARREEFNEYTMDWLHKHFPLTEFKLVNRSSKDKTAYVKENGCLCLVEDRLRTANQASREGIDTYLIYRRWNTGRRTHENITRISHLSTFHSLLVSSFNQYTPTKNKNSDLLGC